MDEVIDSDASDSSSDEESDEEFDKKDTEMVDYDIPIVRHLKVTYIINS